MKKFFVGILSVLLLMGLTVSLVSAANTISFGTTGVGATAIQSGSTVELFTPDGAAGYAYIRLDIPGGIALNAITSLSYNAKVITSGAGGFAPEVILNIDADNDGGLFGTGMDWMFSGHSAASIGTDNFLSGDNWPTTAVIPDIGFINRDALTGYNYWSTDDPRTGFASYWAPFSTILGSLLPAYGIDTTDKVYSIDFVVGTSGSFNGLRVLFESVELNGESFQVASPTPTPTTDVCANIDGDQAGVPDGLHLDASGLNCVAFQLGGPPPPSPATAGQVLGATTLGATGAAEENIFLALFALGSILVGTGVRKLGVSRN